VLDSGCTQHMTGDIRMLSEMSEERCSTYDSITFGDNHKGKVKGLGKVIMASPRRRLGVLARLGLGRRARHA
jgi:hypothetical protein